MALLLLQPIPPKMRGRFISVIQSSLVYCGGGVGESNGFSGSFKLLSEARKH